MRPGSLRKDSDIDSLHRKVKRMQRNAPSVDQSLLGRLEALEARVAALETKRKPGRPRKVVETA